MYKTGTKLALLLISKKRGFDYKEDDKGGTLENRDLLIRYNESGNYTRVYLEVLPKVVTFQKLEYHVEDWPEDTFMAIVSSIVKYKRMKDEIKHNAMLQRMEMNKRTNTKSKRK